MNFSWKNELWGSFVCHKEIHKQNQKLLTNKEYQSVVFILDFRKCEEGSAGLEMKWNYTLLVLYFNVIRQKCKHSWKQSQTAKAFHLLSFREYHISLHCTAILQEIYLFFNEFMPQFLQFFQVALSFVCIWEFSIANLIKINPFSKYIRMN